MRKGQSVVFSNFTVTLAIVVTMFVWLLAGIYQLTGGLPFAGGGAGLVAGCMIAGPGYLPCLGGGIIGSAAGFLGFGGLSMVTGPGDHVEVQVDAATDIYETSSLPGQILHQEYNGEMSMKEALQDYAYCRMVGAVCEIGEEEMQQTLESAADTAIPERNYRVFLRSDGETLVSAQSGGEFSQGPAVYHLFLPVPGGERVTFRLLVDGQTGGVRWDG